MKLPIFGLAVFMLGAMLGERTEASSLLLVTSLSEGERNENAVLKHLWPTLRSAGKTGRIYFRADCRSGDNYPPTFPKVDVQSPSKGETGLAAVREIFRKDRSISVEEEEHGIIRINFDKIPKEILNTKISLLTFEPDAQYNYFLAFAAIENAEEVRAAMSKLGMSVAPRPIIMPTVQPAEELPHLPPSMVNLTMDQALDSVARTFGGIVLYEICERPHEYIINFAVGN
jgi:hypothetical protein